jgi:transcriptional antiterminator RfaH
LKLLVQQNVLERMITEKQNYHWYAVYTRANYEKKLLANLLEKNIECYLPQRKVMKVWSDRKKWVEEPHFRCYIFVKVSYKEFFDVLNTTGAVCYVSFGGKAQAIPEYQIINVKNLLSQVDRDVTLTYEHIKKGDVIEVLYGSLKGIMGEVTNIYGQTRLVIRIDTLNCCLLANISKEEVRFIEKKSFSKSLSKIW